MIRQPDEDPVGNDDLLRRADLSTDFESIDHILHIVKLTSMMLAGLFGMIGTSKDFPASQCLIPELTDFAMVRDQNSVFQSNFDTNEFRPMPP